MFHRQSLNGCPLGTFGRDWKCPHIPDKHRGSERLIVHTTLRNVEGVSVLGCLLSGSQTTGERDYFGRKVEILSREGIQ
jgi:hypothetical protein